MRLNRIIFILVLSWTVAACAPIQPPAPPRPIVAPQPVPEPPIPAEEAENLAWLLGYYRAMHRATPETVAAEYNLAEEAIKKAVTPRNQLRLALLLSLPDPRFHNPGRAMNLLDQYLATPAWEAPVLQNFGYVLRGLISQGNKAEDNVRAAEESYRRITQRLDRAEAENKTLRDQLDALKNIERSLYERQRGQATEAR